MPFLKTAALLASAALALPTSHVLAGPATAPGGPSTPVRAAPGPDAATVFARIRTAQADAGAPTDRQQSGNDAAIRDSTGTSVRSAQPTGPFPTNEVSTQPWIGIDGDAAAYKADVGALQQTLTELQQLKLQTKQAHWNASGTLYYPLHLLLQEHKEGLEKYADTIAERLLAIGASADGRANTIVRTSGIPEIPGGFLDDAQILIWFTQAYKRAGEEVLAAIKATEKADPTTSNLLQEVEHGLAKYQWQMRAHLQRTGTDLNTGWNLNNNKAVELPVQPAPSKP